MRRLLHVVTSILLAFLFSTLANAAPPTVAWAVTTSSNPPLELDQFTFVHLLNVGPRSAMDASGNLYVAASNTSCAVVLKYSAGDGTIAWRRDICPGFTMALALDSAGDVLMTGASGSDALVTKLSAADGSTVWQQLLPPSVGGAAAGVSIGLDSADDARVATWDDGGVVTIYGLQDSDGATQWQRALADPLGDDKVQAFAVAGNGSCVLSDVISDDNNQSGTRTTFLDNFGSIVWQVTTGAGQLAFAPDGNVIASGTGIVKRSAATGDILWSQAAGGKFALDALGNIYGTGLSGPQTVSDIATFKITADGALAWNNVLVDSTTQGQGSAIAIDPQGNPVVAAFAANSSHNFQPTIKYSASDGHVLWIGTDGDASAGNSPHEIQAGPGGAIELGLAIDQNFQVHGLRLVHYTDVPASMLKANPTVALSSTANPSVTGQTVTFAASITGTAGAAGGTVDFLDGVTPIAGCSGVAVSGGSAACTTSSLVAGNHTIIATYSGDTNYNSDSAPAFGQTVNVPVKADPTMSIFGSDSGAPGGQVFFNANLSGSGSFPTGTVTFFDGASQIAGCEAVPVAGGTPTQSSASCATSALSIGMHTINAQYSGDFAYNPASASHAIDIENPPPATMSFTSSANPSTQGDSVTFTWVLSVLSGPAPTGTADFLDGGTAIPGCSAVPISASTAACTTSALTAGTHTISANYSGDANYGTTHTASTITQMVQAAAGQFTLTVSKAGSGSGSVTSSPAGIDCGATCAASFGSGTSVTLTAVADSGSTFSGWSGGGCSGTGSCMVAISAATTVTATFGATVAANPVRLGNIATRGDVLTGENVMIGGFIIGGSANKTVAIVATGPSLAASGVANPLANPTLTLVRSSDQTVIATNDDWQTDANAAQLQASGFAPSDPREAGILVNLPPGAYTAIVSGVGNTTAVSVSASSRSFPPDPSGATGEGRNER